MNSMPMQICKRKERRKMAIGLILLSREPDRSF
jgi:hypothetical protein